MRGLVSTIDNRPHLIRIAVEETESWFLADTNAIRAAYHRAKVSKVANIQPDSVVDAWERLAEILGFQPKDCDGRDKLEWATKIAPHIDLEEPKSPSLKAFVTGVERLIAVRGV